MTEIMTASTQLVSRPADEHFPSLADMRNAAQVDQNNHREVDMPVKDLRFTSLDGSLRVMRKEGGPSYPMTHHAFGQLCNKVGATRHFLGARLTPKVAATALNDAIVGCGPEEAKLLIGTVTKADSTTTAPHLRALTSTGYCRVWDADMLHEVNEWLIPNGFEPAKPTINTDTQRNNIMGNNKPCLFRGDKDSFAFFMTPNKEDQTGHGGRPVRRGIITGNSEVGARSLWTKRFVFDDMCANFIIWGAKAIKTKRIIHRGNDDAALLRRFRNELRQCVPNLNEMEMKILNKANEVIFADSDEKAAERLTKEFGLTQAFAAQAVEFTALKENAGLKVGSHAFYANGVTSAAKKTGNADKLIEMAEVGGDIFAASLA